MKCETSLVRERQIDIVWEQNADRVFWNEKEEVTWIGEKFHKVVIRVLSSGMWHYVVQ